MSSLRVPSMVIGEIVEQFVGLAIQHAIALLNGGLPDGLSQMTFPGAGRS